MDNNNKSISIAPWLQVTLFKGADTKTLKKRSKHAKGKDIKNIYIKKTYSCSYQAKIKKKKCQNVVLTVIARLSLIIRIQRQQLDLV